MSGTATIPPTDPRPLAEAFRSTAPTLPKQAALAAELLRIMTAYDNGTTSRNDLRDVGIDYRSELSRLQGGHLPAPLDVVDDIQNGLAVIKTIGDAGPLLGFAAGSLFGQLAGTEARELLTSFTNTAGDILAIPGVQNYVNDSRMRNGASATADLTDNFAPLFDSAVATVMTRANNDPELLKALMDLHPDVLVNPARTDITAGGTVTDHPEIFNTYKTTIIVQADNSVVIKDIDAARTQIHAEIGAVGDQVTQGLSATREQLGVIQTQNDAISGTAAGIAALLKSQAATQQQKDAAGAARKQAADTMNAVWGGAQGVVTGAAAVASLLGDKKLAKDITRFGSAVITVAKTVVAFADAMSALTKGLTIVTSLGAAAATGNIIGAVASLVSLFGMDQPTPEEQILTEIGHIESSLADLSTEMATGFNRIDERLTAIYTSVMSTLHDISITVNLTYEQSLEINGRLIDQARLLGQFTTEVGDWFRASERNELKEDINTALGWAENNGSAMDASVYGIFSGHFFSWATTSAYDAVNQPLSGRSTDTGAAAKELSGSLSDNISYLNRYLAVRGLPQLVADAGDHTDTAPLPNPQTWALAAGAFAQLRAEWPARSCTSDARPAAIVAAGQGLRDAVQNLAKDRKLLPGVCDEYRQAAAAFGTALDHYRPTFQAQVLPQLLGYALTDNRLSGTVDLAAGTDQPFTFQQSFGRATCAGAADLDAPSHLFLTVPSSFLLAQFLDPGSNHLAAQWSAKAWDERVEHTNPKTHEPWYETRYYIGITVTATWNGVPVSSVGQRFSRAISGDVHEHVRTNWTTGAGYLAILDAQAQIHGQVVISSASTPTAAALTSAAAIAQHGLESARTAFAAQVVAESETGQLVGAADKLQGARTVAENLVRLLLPAPRAGDDLLVTLFDGPARDDGGVRLPDWPAVRSGLIGLSVTDGGRHGALAAWLTEQLADSPTLLQDRVSVWQDAIDAGQFSNRLPDLDDVLDRLAVSGQITAWTAALTAATQVEQTTASALRAAVHLAAPGGWDALTDARLEQVRDAAYRRHIDDVRALQATVGTPVDGSWGPASKAALVTTVRAVQAALAVAVDGDWGPLTDKAYADARTGLRASAVVGGAA